MVCLQNSGFYIIGFILTLGLTLFLSSETRRLFPHSQVSSSVLHAISGTPPRCSGTQWLPGAGHTASVLSRTHTVWLKRVGNPMEYHRPHVPLLIIPVRPLPNPTLLQGLLQVRSVSRSLSSPVQPTLASSFTHLLYYYFSLPDFLILKS